MVNVSWRIAGPFMPYAALYAMLARDCQRSSAGTVMKQEEKIRPGLQEFRIAIDCPSKAGLGSSMIACKGIGESKARKNGGLAWIELQRMLVSVNGIQITSSPY